MPRRCSQPACWCHEGIGGTCCAKCDTIQPAPTEQQIDRLIREVAPAEERGDAESAATWLRCLTAAVREREER